MSRQMHLGLFLLGTGSHTAGWRYPGAVDSFVDFQAIQQIGKTAERGLFDLIFVGDTLYADVKTHPSYTYRLEPLTMLAALAVTTKHIGLGATVSTTYTDPFTVARVFASLDAISGGRAAWNMVTTSNPVIGENFGATLPDHARRYEVASEFVDVVKGLWDCWDDDALVADRQSGLYIDPDKVRSLNHQGEFFKVKGPLNIGRSPQGQPIVLQAGGSEAGMNLAARTADVVFSVVQDIEEARSSYASLKNRLPTFNRQPSDLSILPGVMPVVGRTDKEAREKLNMLQSYIDSDGAGMKIASERFGHDFSVYDLDGPVPDLPMPETYHSFTKVMMAKARRENMTLRDLCSLTGAARGHWVICGSPETIANTLQEWFASDAADGFNIMPPYFHEGFDDFVDLVVPILQERGLYRREYPGNTLRDVLGLSRPAPLIGRYS